MKKVLALKLSLLLLLSSITWSPSSASAATKKNCKTGECVDKLIDRLENLGFLYQKKCLPAGIKEAEIQKYHEQNGITEECWRYITEINDLEKELQKYQAELEDRLTCPNGNCKLNDPEAEIGIHLSTLKKVEKELSCTPPKKEAVRKKCPQDMSCVLSASALAIGGPLAHKMVPNDFKPRDCNFENDNCFTQLATGFLQATMAFFRGSWDILKMAAKKTGEKMGEFWDWVRGAEDHSSTSQLALAKVSSDQSIFEMFLKDFPGTMKKVWLGFIGAINEWLKNDIFCQEWAGTPRFSQCRKPTDSFDCLSCKSMVNGLCAVSGIVLSEIVPSFLTGGLIKAAKYGVKEASKIAKLFKVSDKSVGAIKSSRIAKLAATTGTKVDDALRISKGVQVAKATLHATLELIKKYLLSPTRKVMKQSYAVISAAIKKSKVYLAQTSTGKRIVLAGKTFQTAGRVVIYPIKNPGALFAIQQGQPNLTLALKLGPPGVPLQSTVATVLVANDQGSENLLAKIEEAKIKNYKAAAILKLEQELHQKVKPQRKEVLKKSLTMNNVEFNDIIKYLYPELQYGELSKSVGPFKVAEAENELLNQLKAMPNGPQKNTHLAKFLQMVNGKARIRVAGNYAPAYKQVLDKSKIPSFQQK